jgi:pro-sigmaK processing inhibitor BofA
MKKVILIIKKLIFSFFLLFGLNTIIKSLGIIIPINVINVLIVTILGIPGLISILLIKLFII